MSHDGRVEARVVDFGGINRETGREKNYGFVRLADGSEVFVHKKELLDSCGGTLQHNDVIRCRIGTDRVTGRLCCLDVELIRRTEAA